uniref:Uncharacterized protein n=1 Tax=Chromera velia CCMP2878 TaxID=1169474 RepID=A0A0G4HDU3_9ALVE|eukprot:Cvel_26600.t1-p1 / transcript=Cvel_26600.t1 / gene=Cvel_26600 / organism=Chromera_velia_CCMP2878 / gene_product=hypothetical protein / transcript_product=hypothetical protein / location=Cvel_scaffold3189:2418-4207(-) / protein_length=203 / sequence_SO=supercontig / SO=protein_coding / is_pseudo=false
MSRLLSRGRTFFLAPRASACASLGQSSQECGSHFWTSSGPALGFLFEGPRGRNLGSMRGCWKAHFSSSNAPPPSPQERVRRLAEWASRAATGAALRAGRKVDEKIFSGPTPTMLQFSGSKYSHMKGAPERKKDKDPHAMSIAAWTAIIVVVVVTGYVAVFPLVFGSSYAKERKKYQKIIKEREKAQGISLSGINDSFGSKINK